MKYFDLHCDTIYELIKPNSGFINNNAHIDVTKMLKGQALAQCFAMFVYLDKEIDPWIKCNELIDSFYQIIDKTDEVAFAIDEKQIIKNETDGKISMVLTVEEGGVIGDDINKLKILHNRGVRMMTLTWNFKNAIGSPNFIIPKTGIPDFKTPNTIDGLTPFGIEVIKEMNNLGMIIDVSHLSDAGFYDVAKYSTKPFVASHSNSRTICNHIRNLTDDMLKTLADKGGVTGLNFCTDFIKENSDLTYLDDMVRHVKHIINIAGIDVMALGSDFDGIKPTLEIKDASGMPLLANALLKAGLNEDQLEKIFYKNAMRVFQQNQYNHSINEALALTK